MAVVLGGRGGASKSATDGLVDVAEKERLAAIRRYEILDTPPDGTFDRITRLAARLLDVPIAIVSIVDEDRIWFKARHGIDVEQIPRDPGLCASAILGDEPLVFSRDCRRTGTASGSHWPGGTSHAAGCAS